MEQIQTEEGSGAALLTSDLKVQELLALFQAVAVEQSWQPHGQLCAYQRAAVYFASEVAGRIVGGVQLILGGTPEGMPCLTVWPELGLQERKDVADVALFAFAKPYRGKSNLFWQVLAEVWRYSEAHDIADLWMEVPPRVLNIYRRLGWGVEIKGELRSHWGEECYPCCVGVKALEQVFIGKAKISPFHRAILAQAYRDEPGKLEQMLEEGQQ